jgi:hypothetical protein
MFSLGVTSVTGKRHIPPSELCTYVAPLLPIHCATQLGATTKKVVTAVTAVTGRPQREQDRDTYATRPTIEPG